MALFRPLFGETVSSCRIYCSARAATPAELIRLHTAIGRQFNEAWRPDDRLLDEPKRRFASDRDLMVAVLDAGVIRGGVIAFGDGHVIVCAIGIDAEIRGHGVGRRLVEIVEASALARGARVISLGAAENARGFYERMGYRGKHTMREKQLPPPGAVRSRLIERAERTLVELSVGMCVALTS